MLPTLLSIIAVLTGLASLWFTHKQWQKISKKIGMISNAEAASEVVPAWYTERMMRDYWSFGLVTLGGKTIAISNIDAISDDGKWMDVQLLTSDDVHAHEGVDYITAIAEERRSASIQIEKTAMAYEIVTS